MNKKNLLKSNYQTTKHFTERISKRKICETNVSIAYSFGSLDLRDGLILTRKEALAIARFYRSIRKKMNNHSFKKGNFYFKDYWNDIHEVNKENYKQVIKEIRLLVQNLDKISRRGVLRIPVSGNVLLTGYYKKEVV